MKYWDNDNSEPRSSFYSKKLKRYPAFSELSDEEIQLAIANNTATLVCIGHEKREGCYRRIELYSEELNKRGVKVDPTIEGRFNGIGT
jgi:hypothetical protein|tara:strand:+ start:319 stop:582 length:264 start_codon:yes stop_codon:yes gene_type:complete